VQPPRQPLLRPHDRCLISTQTERIGASGRLALSAPMSSIVAPVVLGSFLGRPSRPDRHTCRLVNSYERFRDAALEFLAVGLSQGERVTYVADHSLPDLINDLAALGDVERLVAAGDLTIDSTAGLYVPGAKFDSTEQLARIRRLVEEALASGYRGLRIAADVTASVATPEASREFLRYELAVDRLIAQSPLSAMCSYDVAVLGAGAADFCAVHPNDDAPPEFAPGFRLCFGSDGLKLQGEVDIINRELFALALSAGGGCTDQRLVIDASELTFIDVNGVLALSRFGGELAVAGRELVVTKAPGVLRRSAGVLNFDGLLHSMTPEVLL
jgi:hypothetical protein